MERSPRSSFEISTPEAHRGRPKLDSMSVPNTVDAPNEVIVSWQPIDSQKDTYHVRNLMQQPASPYNRMEEGAEVDEGGGEGDSPQLKLWARFRMFELAFLGTILILADAGTGLHYKQRPYIPQVTTISSTGAEIVANNTLFSYPVNLNGQECSPATISLCISKALSHPCCEAMNQRAHVYNTVPGSMLIGLIGGLAPAMLLLRHLWLKWGLKVDSSLRDVVVGYLFSMAFTAASTNIIKKMVAMPRPNHFALILYGTYLDNAGGESYISSAWKSFPSGHCSTSMCAFLYVSLLLLQDVRRGYVPYVPQARGVYVALALGPVYIALWVAVTRIWDYWHSGVDALAGLVLGGGWALVAHYEVTPENSVRVKPNARLKYF